MLLLGGAIFLELAGAALFLANYSAGAYMLVTAQLLPLSDTAHMLQARASRWMRTAIYALCLAPPDCQDVLTLDACRK